MEIKIQIKSRKGNLLSEYQYDDDSLKKILFEAFKNYNSMIGANLSKSDLRDYIIPTPYYFHQMYKEVDFSNSLLDRSGFFHSVNIDDSNYENSSMIQFKLTYSHVRNVNFINVNLKDSDLVGNLFIDSDFTNANFNGANLRLSKFIRCNFTNAILTDVNLFCTRFDECNFLGANMKGIIFDNSDLENTSFINTINLPNYAFDKNVKLFGWKRLGKNILVKLEILEGSNKLRSSNGILRCNKVLVIEFQDFEGNKLDLEEYKSENHRLSYSDYKFKIGEIVTYKKFTENEWNNGKHGIGIRMNRKFAINRKYGGFDWLLNK